MEGPRALRDRPRQRASFSSSVGPVLYTIDPLFPSKGLDDDDDDDDKEKGRRKIQIEYIEEKSKRHITFSKRKAGIMKKVSLSCTPLGVARPKRRYPLPKGPQLIDRRG